MTTILDVVKAAQEAERLHKQLLRPHAGQLLLIETPALLRDEMIRSMRHLSIAQDAFRQMRDQAILRDSMGGRIGPDLTALTRPAFEVSRSITALLDTQRLDQSLATFKSRFLEDPLGGAKLDGLKASIAVDWSKQFSLAEAMKVSAVFPLQAHLARLSEWSAMAESSLARVPRELLGMRLGLEAADLAVLGVRHDEFGQAYRGLFRAVEESDLGVLEVPSSLTELPAGEFVNHSALVVSTSEAEVDEDAAEAQREVTSELAIETSDYLTILVAEINPELTHLLSGAREAYDSQHTDYVRHFVTSYRELFTHLLHALAPDAAVEKWTTDPGHFHNNRPTRRARLLYLTRDLGPMFGGFMCANVEAALAFIDVFQKGTHGIKPSFTSEQLADMKNRTEGLLRFMLTANQIAARGM